jgi:hypothetical protein
MVNLMLNSNWCETEQDALRFYRKSDKITRDRYSFAGNRSCSVMLSRGEEASLDYLLPIDVAEHDSIQYSFLLRAVEAESITLVVNFSDQNDQLLASVASEIADRVTARFSRPWVSFAIPHGAVFARCSIRFSGVVTACTFLSPFAYFYS